MNNKFDDIIKNKYSEYSLQPPMQLWDAVDQAIREDDSKKTPFYWSFLGSTGFNKIFFATAALGIAFLGLYWYGISSPTKTQTTINKEVLLSKENPQTGNKNPNHNQMSILAAAKNSDKKAKNYVKKNPTIENNIDKNQKKNVLAKYPFKKKNNLNSNKPFKNNQYSVFAQTSTRLDKRNILKNPTNEVFNKKTLKTDNEEKSIGIPFNTIVNKNQSVENIGISSKNLDLLSSDKITNSSLDYLKQNLNLLQIKTAPTTLVKYDPECYDFGGGKNSKKFYVEVDAGAMQEERTLELDNTENSSYINVRDTTEITLNGFQSSALIGVLINNKWSVKTGLDYRRWRSRFNYQNSSEIQTVITINESTQTQPDGTSITVFDTTTTVTTGTRNIQQFNTISVVEIPFLVGYEKSFNSFFINLSAGVGIKVNNSTKGKILSNSLQVIDLEDSNNNLYSTSVSLSLLGELQLGYKITQNIDAFVKANYYKGLSDWTTKEYPVIEKWSAIGGKVGIRYNF